MPLTPNRHLPGFDLAMELLCLLPRAPIGAPLDLVAADLSLMRQQDVRQLFARLDQRRIRVKTFRPAGTESNLIAIDPATWEAARREGERYVELMELEETAPMVGP